MDLLTFLTGYSTPATPRGRLNVVLDLDETCVCSNEGASNNIREALTRNDPRFDKSRMYSFSIPDTVDLNNSSSIIGIKRPHLDAFITFCFNYFNKVIVWSAGKYQYVHAIVDRIFQHHKQPDMILTYDNCMINRGILIKPLSTLYAMDPNINEKNTMIVDDRVTVFDSCNPGNGILIPPYDPFDRREDTRLLELMTWLNSDEVMTCNDVTKLVKTNIFSP